MRRDAVAIAAFFAVACTLVRATGFDHVSDDDFARVAIAQAFARSPRLDPSGTSWLPFPFWVNGALLAVFGRELATARVVAVVLASLGAPLPYLAMRAVGVARASALVATAIALVAPWPLWLGASTVPEAWTACATAAAAILLGARASASERARVLGAVALTAACLSRYEPWPVAAVLGVVLAWRAAKRPRERRTSAVLAAVCVAGPLAWIVWNMHAHGAALHFVHRVTAYRRAIGEGTTDVLAALALYPRLLATTRPDLLVAALVGATRLRDATLRARWSVPLACAGVVLAFLAYGAVTDGAPTHHAERPLLAVTIVLAAFAGDALVGSARARLAIGAWALGWLFAQRPFASAPPGTSEGDARDAQVARGLALRGAERLDVTPCAYEHFALVAAFGAPERVTIRARTGAPLTRECPAVTTPPP